MKNLKLIDFIALTFLIIGGLNMGVIAVLKLNVIGDIFGTMSIISRVIYLLAGLGALRLFVILERLDKK